jgi:SRSO17 transposase
MGHWQRLSSGDGTKGARLHDWAYLELADLHADEYDETKSGLWTCGLLIRRTISDGELAFFTTWCPAGTDIQALVAVEGRRWAIEDSFETTRNELGLDHNETRSWHGWHRHVSLVMLGQRRIQPAYIIAWSCWRRAHQAAARKVHIKCRMQL